MCPYFNGNVSQNKNETNVSGALKDSRGVMKTGHLVAVTVDVKIKSFFTSVLHVSSQGIIFHFSLSC
jgi:hypothetical protein